MRGRGQAVRVHRAAEGGGGEDHSAGRAGGDEGWRNHGDCSGIRIRPGGIGGVGNFDPIFSCVSEHRSGEGGGGGANGCGGRAGCALIPLVSQRFGADGGDCEGSSEATGDGDGCRVGDDPRIGRGHGSIALPGGRGEAGLAGEVIDGEAGGSAVKDGPVNRRGASGKEGGFKPGGVVECVISDAGDAGGEGDAR